MTEKKKPAVVAIDLTTEDDKDDTDRSTRMRERHRRLLSGWLNSGDIGDFVDFIMSIEECPSFIFLDGEYFLQKWRRMRLREPETPLMFIRVTGSGHHLLVVANNDTKKFHVKNSLRGLGATAARKVCDILKELGFRLEHPPRRSREYTHQKNGSDCGVFVILNTLRAVTNALTVHGDVYLFNSMTAQDMRQMMVKYENEF
jgi:hypothetical protein